MHGVWVAAFEAGTQLRPHPEERRRSLSSGRASRGPVGRVSKDGHNRGLAAILRDARKERAPQDEVGDIFTASFAGTTLTLCATRCQLRRHYIYSSTISKS